jgi:hypothetical protein
MKWRFVDRIEQFEPWRTIRCVKTVSFEEYSLLERWGRGGEFPASLMLEAAVEAGRWLAMASSDFALAASLAEVRELHCLRPAARGEVLRTTVTVKERGDACLEVEIVQEAGGTTLLSGRLELRLSPLGEAFDATSLRGLWNEIASSAVRVRPC